MRYLSLFSGIEAASAAWAPLGWECVGVSEIEPFPCAVLAQRHPGVPNLGDITKITESDIARLGGIDLVVFGSPCFTAGHTVLTARGLVPIESVVVGDSVWTHASRWKKVTDVMTRVAPTVVVNGQGHNEIRATPDHPFYAAETIKTWNGNGYTRTLAEPQWVHAASMQGKRWATPVNLTCDAETPDVLRGVASAYLAGLYVGDGHIGRTAGRNKKSVILSVSAAKRDKMLPALREAWGTVSEFQHGKSVLRLQLSRTNVANSLLCNFGEYSHAKTLPVWALCADREWQEAFLQGVLDTDGSAFGSGWRVTTVSRALAVGLRLLAARLGYSTSLRFDKRPETCVIEGRTVNQRDTWTVALRKGNRTSELRTDEHAWGLVRSVTPAGDDTVFDITVEDDHSFICDGIVVHNCQDLSVAGKRKGLDGERSGLFFTAMRVIEWARVWGGCRFALWENVPGAFSSNTGADFGVVVGQMAGHDSAEVPPKGWGTEGAIVGPQGMVEWSVLDAQWFGVAQRRRRVFAIADFGDWANRPPILLEPESLRGDSAPSREAGQSVAGTLASRTGAGGYTGTDEVCDGHVICSAVSPTLDQRAGRSGANSFATSGGLIGLQRPVLTFALQHAQIGRKDAAGPQGKGWQVDVAFTQDSRSCADAVAIISEPVICAATGQAGAEITTGYSPTLNCNHEAPYGAYGLVGHSEYAARPAQLRATGGDCGGSGYLCVTGQVTHTLKAAGFDASEDGTGRGTPIVPVAFDTTQITSPMNFSNPKPGDPCHPLAAGAHPPAVAYGFQPRIARNGRGDMGDVVSALNAQSGETGKGDSAPCVAIPPMQVRRLTPMECERLQAFPDDFTLITVRGRPAADGPRYKALGNSMCVNVMHWIGKQIDHVVTFY